MISSEGEVNNGMISAKNIAYKNRPEMVLKEVNSEMTRIRSENNQLRARAEYIDRNLMDVMQENAIMHNRIENLENVFLIKDIDKEEDNYDFLGEDVGEHNAKMAQ